MNDSTFETWFYREFPSIKVWGEDLEEALKRDMLEPYKAGWDACRDKWGGMTYDESIEDFQDEN